MYPAFEPVPRHKTVGKFGGGIAKVSGPDLGATVVKALLARSVRHAQAILCGLQIQSDKFDKDVGR